MYDRLVNLLVEEQRLQEFVSGGDPTAKDRLRSAGRMVGRAVLGAGRLARKGHGMARDAAIENLPKAGELAGRAVGKAGGAIMRGAKKALENSKARKARQQAARLSRRVSSSNDLKATQNRQRMRQQTRQQSSPYSDSGKPAASKPAEQPTQTTRQTSQEAKPAQVTPDARAKTRLRLAGLSDKDYKPEFDTPLGYSKKGRKALADLDPEGPEFKYRAATTMSNVKYPKALTKARYGVAKTRLLRRQTAARGGDPRTGIERALGYRGKTVAGAVGDTLVRAMKAPGNLTSPTKSVY